MLNKLRNKIVLTNLIFVGVLLIVISVVLCVAIANNELFKMNKRLDLAVRYVSEAPEADFMRSFGFETNRNSGVFNGEDSESEDGEDPAPKRPDGTRPPLPDGATDVIIENGARQTIDGAAFSVLLDAEGNILSKKQFFASMDDESLAYALAKVESAGTLRGTVSELDLAFAKKNTVLGTAVAFTSKTEADTTIRNSIIIAAGLDIVILAFVALISFRLASLSVKPVREAWDSQKRFIADASHELKTPLTVILANNSILELSEKDPNNMQWLESNRYEAERMQKLIEEMLFLAKNDEGGYRLFLGEADISDIAEQTCLSFEPVAFDQSVFIETAIEKDVRITTDSSMVEKVLIVLIDNAVKHSPEGGTVTLSLEKDAKNVRLSVHNTGEPIAKDDLPHIFERFYKADTSRVADSAKSGFGLGLAIAHDIVEKLGGTITAKSSSEEGTTFTVTLKNQ
ncbi:MAG: HAMP domain-containing histidine kinase [Clostridia bacterium]|nr:HAMP domain-containing histidine kinase [Clostridia bacterium]